MRILIDCRMLDRPKTGIGNYLEQLVNALDRIDTENEFTLFRLDRTPGRRPLSDRFLERSLRIPNPLLTRVLRDSAPPYRLMRTLSRDYDLVHEPAFEPLPLAPRSVVTIHDMILFRRPQDYTPQFAARYQKRIRASVQNASQIIADSENTRRDLVELLAVPPHKVQTILLAADPQWGADDLSDDAGRCLAAAGISKPYLLSIGDLYRRKNNITLVQAWIQLPRDIRDAHQLVIAGAPKEASVTEELQAAIQASGAARQILLLGYVPDALRRTLLRRAEALLYPSLYEGFGLPPLEAMACGVPTVSSRNSSIPEVVGDAGVLVSDFESPDAWAQEITQILSDSALRRGCIEKGRTRAGLFTWEQTARQTLQIYKQAMMAPRQSHAHRH